MSLRLASQKIASRSTPLIFTRAASRTAADRGADPKKTPHPEKSEAGHDQWMASLASESEQAVKADRSHAFEGEAFQGMQQKTREVAEEMKDSTASLTDGLWRSVGGGK